MSVIQSLWTTCLVIVLLPFRLVYLLVRLAMILPEMVRDSWAYGKDPESGAHEVEAALDVPIHARAPEAQAADDMVESFAADYAGGRALALLDRIAEADRSRELTSGRHVVSLLAVRGAMKRFDDAMEARNSTAITAACEDLEELVKVRPNDHVAACLLAQAYIDIGWKFRGGGYINDIPRENMAIFLQHFEKARLLLEPFDAMALNSPLVARTRYHLIPGIDHAETKVNRWYYEWSTLAPKHWECHSAYAWHMLPQWFGQDFASLDRVAHDACQRLSGQVGAAPYFFFMMAAERCLPDALEQMDLPLFLKSIDDICVVSPTQSTVNMLVAALLSFSNKVYGQSDADARRRAEVRQAMVRLVKTRLRELHLEVWRGKREDMLAAVEISFHDELKAGARIRAGVEGLEAILPPAGGDVAAHAA